ncbi:MAG: hypothetical protein JW938_04245 [Candidatus Omnitrophica bacterium]|nr:hypothetical protein [Candidatus Omnitrophota bacterium]
MGQKPDFKILTGTVISVSPHGGDPYTIEFKTTSSMEGVKYDALTVDPRCTFYKDDKIPKTIDIVKPLDVIEVTYLLHEGVKVAFNIIVKPKVEV